MTLYSPGVEVKEKDFSTIVPTVSSGVGGAVGRFSKGPIMTPVLISSEQELLDVFGKPQNDQSAVDWFTIAQFLQYTDKCWVVRASSTTNKNAVATGTAVAVLDPTDFFNRYSSLTSNGSFIARDLGKVGNSLQVVVLDKTSGSTYADYGFTYAPGTTAAVSAVTLSGDVTLKNDELHVAVIDRYGYYSGTPGTVLERFPGLSKASNATNYNSESIYYINYINNNSKYVYATSVVLTTVTGGGADALVVGSSLSDVGASNKKFADLGTGTNSTAIYNTTLTGGTTSDVSGYAQSDITNAFALLANKEQYDVNLLFCGAFGGMSGQTNYQIEKYVLENVAYVRKDAVAFMSPNTLGTPITSAAGVKAYKTSTVNSAEMYTQYGFLDTGFKWIYDKYNSVYRWVPLNGDMAGLCARTDSLADPWFSPGGFTRGGVKNVIKLSLNPTQAERDDLYPQGINPVVSFPGQGVVLFGDRTMTTKPSAFDRINVRRLFNVLEKSIAIAAKYQLFEFNDTFTRAQFRNMVEPYLRNIQGRRGIQDFLVVCDESNNTGTVIDNNQFVADIYIKPARSVNFITLNFVATRSDVQFSTLIGA